jgi:hypothetical protein
MIKNIASDSFYLLFNVIFFVSSFFCCTSHLGSGTNSSSTAKTLRMFSSLLYYAPALCLYVSVANSEHCAVVGAMMSLYLMTSTEEKGKEENLWPIKSERG